MTNDASRVISVVIVGAGISGIAQAVRLQEALGDHVDFKIYDRSYDVGGVWRDSAWPGAGVDVPIHLYSLYSHPNPDFSQKWASRDEVLAYWKRIAAQHRLHDKFVFRSEFVSSHWDNSAQQHTVEFRNTQSKETFEVVADVLISATGALNLPKIPNVTGRETFKGLQWHSSQWRDDVDLRGKKVAVVGNGSSGIQIIPNIVEIEGLELINFIRSPGFFRPKENFNYSGLTKSVFRHVPFALRLYRWSTFQEYDWGLVLQGTGKEGSSLREQRTKELVDYMKEQLPEEYWDELIAEYPLDCKRVGYDAGWLASFRRSNVQLVSSTITAVTENGIETENGESYDVDIIIWATGFHVTDTGIGLSHGVYGEDGVELSEKYKARGGAYGYLGVGLPEVPNYFAVLGPNSIAMSWGYTIGNNTEFIARLVRGIYDHRLSSIVAKASAIDDFNTYVQSRVSNSIWYSPECGDSWYKDPASQKVTVPAPWGATELWAQTRKIRWEDWTCRRRDENGDALLVDIRTPWNWTPFGVLMDWAAEWQRQRFEQAMVKK
ncbi:hypothetical protein JCM8115_005920 [Rhodotorula mucilaginosa]|nr:hypothetical protein B0A53_05606 [Rhodotorula sp. CCFEE 5036]